MTPAAIKPTIDNLVKVIKAIRTLTNCSLLTGKVIAEFKYTSAFAANIPVDQADVVVTDANVDRLARSAIDYFKGCMNTLIASHNEVKDVTIPLPEAVYDYFRHLFSGISWEGAYGEVSPVHFRIMLSAAQGQFMDIVSGEDLANAFNKVASEFTNIPYRAAYTNGLFGVFSD